MARFTKRDLLYMNKFKDLPEEERPAISLFGLHRYVFGGILPQYTPVPCPPLQKLNEANFRPFLKGLFSETPLDPDRVLPRQKEDGTLRSENTRNNSFRLLLRHRGDSNLTDFFADAPTITPEVLDQVAKNIRTLIPDSHPSWEWLPSLVRDLLVYLAPGLEEEIRTCSPDKGLALLAVAAFPLRRYPKLLSIPVDRFIHQWLIPPKAEPDASRNPGLYTDTSILPDLLPPVKIEGRTDDYRGMQGGSPLFRLIFDNPDIKQFLLCGKEKTAVSGAGKTSALKYLVKESKRNPVLYLPLAQVYSPRAVRSSDPLEQYLRRVLHIEPEFGERCPMLLMDGLDEVCREGLPLLCDDLDRLLQANVRLILTCRTPIEDLPAYGEYLCRWTSLWRRFTPCHVLPMTREQRKTGGELGVDLDTPFLLSLFRQSRDLPAAPATTEMVARWGAGKLFSAPPSNAAQVFYAYLAAHTVRNFEIFRGDEQRAEGDAFLLFRTLPAIAFRQFMTEINDGNLHPAVTGDGTTDREGFKEMIRLSLAACRKGLTYLPGYRNADDPALLLQMLDRSVTFEGYRAGSLPGLFPARTTDTGDPFDPWREEFTFLSLGHRDLFAALHVANVFLLARADAIPDRHELLPFLGCTLEYLPPVFLKNVADFVELMLPEGEELGDILNGAPPILHSPLSRFLTEQIGGFLCPYATGASDPDQGIKLWFCRASSDFLRLPDQQIRQHYMLSQAVSLAALSRRYRRSNMPNRSEMYAMALCRLQTEYDVPLSDGQHLMALVFWSYLVNAYNGWNSGKNEDSDDIENPISTEKPDDAREPDYPCHLIYDRRETNLFPWLTKAPHPGPELLTLSKDILAALESLAAGGSGAPVFLHAGPEVAEMAPGFIAILRSALAVCEAAPLKMERTRFLSLKAKAYSIYAACAPGASGMAMNLLASFLVNDMEVFEHDPRLPLFQKHPELLTDTPDLSYGENRFCMAFSIYRRIAGIRRGKQPWSAREASALLLRGQVRLDEKNRPIPGDPQQERVYTNQELELLDRLTLQGLAGRPAVTYEYWRIRYLADAGRTEEAKALLKPLWVSHRCRELLLGNEKTDLVSVQLLAEALGIAGCLQHEQDELLRAAAKYLDDKYNEMEGEQLFTTGSRLQPFLLEDVARRIRSQGQKTNPRLVESHFKPVHF